MIKHHCDRCDKVCEGNELRDIVYISNFDGGKSQIAELCGDCLAALRKWAKTSTASE